MALTVSRFDGRRWNATKLQKLTVFETSRFFLDVYCLERGQQQKPHRHDDAEKVYAVLEGQVTVQVGVDAALLGPGEAVLCPAGIDHGISNLGDGRAVLLVFMTPRPLS